MRGEAEASWPFNPSLDRRAWLRYAVAVGCLVLAFALGVSLTPILGVQLPTLTFFPAIVLSARFGGFGPGLLITALSCVTVLYLFVEPTGRLAISDGPSGIGLALFFGFGALTSFLTAATRESERRSQAAQLQPVARNAHQASMLSTVRRAEEELRRSEAYLAEAERLSHTGSWAWNVSTGDLYWSREHFRIFGLVPENVTPSYELFFKMVHPDDRSAVRQMFEQAVSEARDYETSYRVVCADGSVRDVHSISHPAFNEAGELTEYVGTIIDITDRRRAEEELRRSEAYLAEGQKLTHTGSWGWNVMTGEIYWSREQYRIFGRDRQRGPPSLEEAFDLVHPDDCALFEQALADVLRKGTDLEWDSRVIGSDGAIKYVHTTAHPVTASGELTEIIGTTMDITERRQAEAERATLLRDVISAHEEERRRISREIHDELGQQVSALVLNVSALKQDCANRPELRAQMASIEDIEDVLYHLDSGVDFLVWNVRPTALNGVGLAAALSRAIRHWSKHARAHAQLHTVGMEKHRLPADIEVALYRVVQEALNNIAKHADATTVHVCLECRADYVSLIVEDDGKGFDTDKVLSDAPGAGLFGMRERATHVGGTFEVESHRGRGTTLVVQIPLGGVSTDVQDDG
jgi:PAS domain S-box-containing protein